MRPASWASRGRSTLRPSGSQDLADAFGQGNLPTVKGYGATLNDVGAILATFGDNNLRGAAAGTEMRMAVQALAEQASTAGPALKELGLSAGQIGANMREHGVVSTLNMLNDRMKAAGLTAQTERPVITELFGKKAGSGSRSCSSRSTASTPRSRSW
jgi:TP901 family phage tail tape measure protein